MVSSVLVPLVLLLVTEPAVAVDARGPLAEALHARLLDEGYRLVPRADAADVELLVTEAADGVRLEARGEGREALTRWIDAGPAGAVRLELLQQAVLAVRAQAPDPPRPRGEAVVLRVEGSGGAALWPHVAGRLLAAQHAIAVRPAAGDRVVCAQVEAHEVAWSIVGADVVCPAGSGEAVGWERGARGAEERWVDAVIARLAEPEVARAPPSSPPSPPRAAPTAPSVAVAAPPAVARPSAVTPPSAVAVRPAAARAFSAALVGAVSLRAGGVDPALEGALDFGPDDGFGGLLRLGATYGTGERTLSTTEVSLTAGPRHRWALAERVAVEVGAAVGLRLHLWSVDPSASGLVDGSGVRAELLAQVPLRGRVRLLESLSLDLWVTPGIGGGGRSHVAQGTSLWERSPLQVVVGLGLSSVLAGGNSPTAGE